MATKYNEKDILIPQLGTITNDLLGIAIQKARQQITDKILGRNGSDELSIQEKKDLQRSRIVSVNSSGSFVGPSQFVGSRNAPTNADKVDKKNTGIFILDLITNEKLELQFIPHELDYDPDSKFEPIASMGRNNPLYHYTGSEDTLTFEIDWHSNSDPTSRTDVITKCKWIEALTKNDGFNGPPHPIKLIWGGGQVGLDPTLLFRDANWLITKAPYKLKNFHRKYSMLPVQAIQSLTLKKITETNLTRANIMSISS